MPDMMQQPEEINSLDLAKYGLLYLRGNNLLALDGSDMDKLLKALGEDDISLNIPIPCTPHNVWKILAYAECRRCGGCCIPNPLNPESPGVEVFNDELKSIANYLNLPFETLKEKTANGKVAPHPFAPNRLAITRWLPLPCPFYDENLKECQVYPVRPVVCEVYPVIFTGDDTYLAIKANCDYGKDLIKAALREVRRNSPELVIEL